VLRAPIRCAHGVCRGRWRHGGGSRRAGLAGFLAYRTWGVAAQGTARICQANLVWVDGRPRRRISTSSSARSRASGEPSRSMSRRSHAEQRLRATQGAKQIPLGADGLRVDRLVVMKPSQGPAAAARAWRPGRGGPSLKDWRPEDTAAQAAAAAPARLGGSRQRHTPGRASSRLMDEIAASSGAGRLRVSACGNLPPAIRQPVRAFMLWQQPRALLACDRQLP